MCMNLVGVDSVYDLKVGMRVIVDSTSMNFLIQNELATIIYLEDEKISLEGINMWIYFKFDNIVDGGHTCGGLCEYGYGRLIHDSRNNVTITVINDDNTIMF